LCDGKILNVKWYETPTLETGKAGPEINPGPAL
jgi:hypothetical protein